MKCLIIGLQYPEPQSTAAGERMLQIIRLLKSFDFVIYFASSKPRNQYSIDLEFLSVTQHHINLNDKNVDVWLNNLQPDMVIFDRFITEEQFGWRVDEQCPLALKILDTEDLHFLREKREVDLKKSKNHNDENFLSDKAKRELAAIYRCDWSLMISKVEIDILTKTYNIPRQLLFYLPFVYETGKLLDYKTPTYAERTHFVSIGNFKHKPNLDMVQHLYKNIWSKIRKKLPKAEWHIYGAYCPEHIQQLHNHEKGVIVKGRANEVLSTLENYKVMLAALRFGAGLKGKCLDSMRAGTPSITTEFGAEGIASTDNWSGFIENHPEDFVQKAVKLYTDESLWTNKQKQGFKILKTKFDIQLFRDKFQNKITESLQNLRAYRQQNITGELLKHHHHRSTKFMSLWIEAKNTLS